MSKELVALVLAGGEGKRFWPLTTNKITFPFLGRPLYEHSVVSALPKEVDRIVVVASDGNYEAFTKATFPKPHTVILQEKSAGMADAMLSAESALTNSQLLIFIADDVFDSLLPSKVMEKASSHSAFGVIPGWKSSSYFHGGYFILDGDRIVGMKEKPGEGNQPSPYVDISGQYIADSNVLIAELKRTKSQRDDVYEKAKTSLMQRKDFLMVPYEGDFVSLKYPWNALDIMDFLLRNTMKEHKGKNLVIKQNVVIEGPVWIGDKVKIFENTKIVGPCYIGDNTIVGNNNMIRHSHIGADCVTGFNTDITRSYVGDHCWFHSNYVGDSVLEGNVSMGAGAVLANLRLDEGPITSVVKGERINTGRNKLGTMIARDVRVGVHTSVMPGVKIGTGSMIGAGLIIDRDIPDGSFVAGGMSLTVTKNTRTIQGNRDSFKKELS